jgi:hypothetical protein
MGLMGESIAKYCVATSPTSKDAPVQAAMEALLGRPPESADMRGIAAWHFVREGDALVAPPEDGAAAQAAFDSGRTVRITAAVQGDRDEVTYVAFKP